MKCTVLTEEERTKQDQARGSECHSDAHVNVQVQDVEPVKAATIKDTGHTNECLEED